MLPDPGCVVVACCQSAAPVAATRRVRGRANFSNGSNVICPVQPRLQKYSASHLPQINRTTPRIPSHQEGRFAIVTDVGCGMRWTRQRRAREGSQGGFSVSDYPARRRPALKRLRQDFDRQHMSRSKRFGGGSCGRQKRVVLAPVAGVKLMEIQRTQPGFGESLIRQRRWHKELRTQERAISRKTIAQGRPGVPAHLAVTRVHFCARSRVLRAPGFPCAL